MPNIGGLIDEDGTLITPVPSQPVAAAPAPPPPAPAPAAPAPGAAPAPAPPSSSTAADALTASLGIPSADQIAAEIGAVGALEVTGTSDLAAVAQVVANPPPPVTDEQAAAFAASFDASGDNVPDGAFAPVDVGGSGGQAVTQVPAWIVALQKAIGGPMNSIVVEAYEDWAASEGMANYANNPLAATDAYPGSTPYPPSPTVQVYPSLAALVDVYKRKFESATYAAVGKAFEQGSSLEAIYEAINASPWCGGCQGGHYPVDLYNAVFGDVATKASAPPVQAQPSTEPAKVTSNWVSILNMLKITFPAHTSSVKEAAGSLKGVFK